MGQLRTPRRSFADFADFADFDDLGNRQVRRGEGQGGPVGLEPVPVGTEAEDQLTTSVGEGVGGRPEPSSEGSQLLDGTVLAG